MPLILLCSIWSYWQTVNVEMANATLQFLDEVERESGGPCPGTRDGGD
jgi:hypothetical protein